MKLVVVGSGPSGASAALTLLRRGQAVELWDVGRREQPFPHPEADFHGLKQVLDDPQAYFLGKDFQALLAPDSGELMRYPPARSFLVEAEDRYWPFLGEEFKPFLSFSAGGLGLGWGVNALSYDDDDLTDWPLSFPDLSHAYSEACQRIPIAGPEDELSRFFPGVVAQQPSVRLNRHDADLLSTFEKRKAWIERWGHITLGRARLAVLNTPDDPSACRYCGRCLWGCPHGSLYNPAGSTLRECQRYPNFSYQSGRLVLSFETRDGLVTGIRYLETDTQQRNSEPCAAVFLAAGALQSGAIFLRTLQRDTAMENANLDRNRTESVMDTTVVKMPYIQIRSVGVAEESRQFQFNRLIIAHRKTRNGGWPIHCHGEVLSLNTLIYHPLIESIPLGSRLGKRLFAALMGALGVVTYFLPDRQIPGNGISLVPDATSPTGDHLQVHYQESADKEALLRDTVKDTARALWMMACVPARPIRAPAGGGIHYAGTVPMGPGPRCSDSSGRANAFRNLYLCDGAAFPSLPSKSITLNLIAHAIRVASLAHV